MQDAEQPTWSISEVEKLVGLSRRDIQRCCYDGRGGVGLLTSTDGSWGRRSYGIRDLALLFIVAQHRRNGELLSSVAKNLKKDLESRSLIDLLEDEEEKLADQLHEHLSQLVCAETISAVLQNEPDLERRLQSLDERFGDLQASLPEIRGGEDSSPLPGTRLLKLLLTRFSNRS